MYFEANTRNCRKERETKATRVLRASTICSRLTTQKIASYNKQHSSISMGIQNQTKSQNFASLAADLNYSSKFGPKLLLKIVIARACLSALAPNVTAAISRLLNAKYTAANAIAIATATKTAL